MNNQEYWSRRFEDLKNEQMKRAELTAAQLKKLYEQALRDAQDEVLAWYQRYARENNLSLQEARKQLDTRELKAFHLTLEEFKRLAKQKNLSPEYRRMLDNASIRVRLDRSQALMIKLRDIIEKLAKEQQVRMEEVLKKTYEDSYYKAAYETQKVTGYAPLNGIQEETVRKVLSKPWAADGRDFSARIWGQRDQLVNALQIEVTRCLISHKGTGTMAKRIAKRFNTSFANASRLVETEVAYIQERGALDSFAALGVEQVKLLAVLDNRTSEICQELDGKIVDLKDAEPGVTTPPFHCYCRTTVIPVSEFDTEESTRAARDPLTGKTVQVPGDLTYKEWYNEYVKPTTKPTGKGTYKFTENGKIIPTVTASKTKRYSPTRKGEPNAVIEFFTQRGKQRNIHVYDENGFIAKWFHMGAHGNAKNHPYGARGEHVHDFSISDNPKKNRRELSENEYILMGGSKDG